MDTNYFVCTLGQAAALREKPNDFHTINDFIDRQASRVGDQPAVGFFKPPGEHHVFSFADVERGSKAVAGLMLRNTGQDLCPKQTVALLCPSSPDFLFAWLALMRLGHAVLLIAPQCQPPAIAHLCKACEVSNLFHDDVYEDQARRSAQEMDGGTLRIYSLPSIVGGNIYETVQRSLSEETHFQEPIVDDTSVAYLHHTSGTSSGLPKPIPQTHRAGVGVLPCLPDGSEKATYTTTPLYHGGIADLFRAWTSDALIWLFPGKELPITASSIISCLDTAKAASDRGETPLVRYFSSVPYVLQMMEADSKGLEYLTSMDIVGVGGAALPTEVGDRLVKKGVNLISRFGSAECGFLMSSHRDYAKDKEWQCLRSDFGADKIRFEKQDDGTSELVIMSGWPHKAKTNREDGSFATADLFSPHPEIPNAWKYHSRADSQLTLITGKKFDPAPWESAIAANEHVDDVLVFGNGKPFPGAFLFRSKEHAHGTDDEFLKALQPLVEKLNAESQAHARIPRNMLIAMQHNEEPLEKSSKGTVMRNKAEERYAQQIEDAYAKLSVADGSEVPDEGIQPFVVKLIQDIVVKPGKLFVDTDLFLYGADSVACMQIRYGLRQLLPAQSPELPLSIVEDCGTVQRLSDYITKQRHGEVYEENEDDNQLMLDLVEKYGQFDNKTQSDPSFSGNALIGQPKEVVILTGATGALGSHLLNLYRKTESVSQIFCLVRGADQHAARERVNKALEQRGMPGISSEHPGNDKIIVLQSSLGEAGLGLEPDTYEEIARNATVIMHIAWSVNFRMRLRSFEKDNIAGLRNLINLALHSPRRAPPRFVYCSSVASAINCTAESPIPEHIMHEPTSASPLGYSRSKWVAEHLCFKAHRHTALHNQIAVFRVGQLGGDTKHGIWNTSEAWPLMLSSVRVTNSLPALRNEPLNWLPVDVAAEAFIEAANNMGMDTVGRRRFEMQVYHFVNPHQTPDWMQLLGWLQAMEKFDVLEPEAWVDRLERARDEGKKEHPAMKLLGLWKKNYCEKDGQKEEGKGKQAPVFALDESKKVAPALGSVKAVDEEYFRRVWKWLQAAKVE
ncbi:uncharacterized protein K452DRAFT_318826 [Aplosporella prunicola CBS 121167]|uniref:Carrier domain-containing protein n=1 Tax=Aplosporella prunicola CBS 121167 TaxID=1176127 RepID=A0A6A6BCN0_9PEZI|nr:uncharacterized protein K452DRAFT_318826 [Aplosporella prunicola CBS 121167]KAF2141900.1 hypothetical protein K452DRAFT_318826 [Aplosporella prunicola CBS 121167]